MNKIGKIGKRNIKAYSDIKDQCIHLGVTGCEVKLPFCLHNRFLSFAHRHKRVWYRSRPELLSDKKQWVVACQVCHGEMEYNKVLTEQVFIRLRGKEDDPN